MVYVKSWLVPVSALIGSLRNIWTADRLLIRRSITATDESDSAFFPGTSRVRMQMSSWDFGNRLDPIPKNLVRA
jgi:hypothetical protein